MVTHQMEEVERLCDRVLLLKNGTAEAYGSIAEVQDQFGGRMVRLKYSGDIPESPHYSVALREKNYAELMIADGVDEAVIARELVEAGVQLRGFATSKLSLDEIFVRVYGDQSELGAGGGAHGA